MYRYSAPLLALLIVSSVSLLVFIGFELREADQLTTDSSATDKHKAKFAMLVSELPAGQSASAAEGSSILEHHAIADEAENGNMFAPDFLYQGALESADARKALMERYLNAVDDDSKRILGAVLSSLPTDDTLAFAIKLAESADAQQRKDGFSLLEAQNRPSERVRELARQALDTETDPDTLRRALVLLQPAVTEMTENSAVLQQVQSLVQHQNPAVRAQAIDTMANWDKTGESTGVLQQALADAEVEVRWAAVAAIYENRIRSDGLKTALIEIAANREETTDLRMSAAKTLENFLLDKSEYAYISQISHDLEQHLN